ALAAGGGAEAVVLGAVAVVVEAVADLGRGDHVAHAGAPLALQVAGRRALMADADALGRERPRVAGLRVALLALAALVDHPVAVVVDAVAALGRGHAAGVAAAHAARAAHARAAAGAAAGRGATAHPAAAAGAALAAAAALRVRGAARRVAAPARAVGGP